jgi:GNAT superfamily N-acetyltransferase
MYLEDFYIRPEFRGAGLAMVVLQTLTKLAVDYGCKRLTWQAYDWNERAIAFYERKAGAKKLSEWLTFRLDSEAMANLLD